MYMVEITAQGTENLSVTPGKYAFFSANKQDTDPFQLNLTKDLAN